MGTCERCGADTVDAAGRCHTCGWQTKTETDELALPSPSLGQTRAVESPSQPPASGVRPSNSRPSFDQTVDLPWAPTPSQPPARATRVPATGAAPAARYCGVCGARITGNEAFCGQCGTPIGQATGQVTTAYSGDGGAPSRYQVGASGPWSGAQPDDLTEAYLPAPAPGAAQGFGRMAAGPYSGPSYRPAGPVPAGRDLAAARRTRIVVGLLLIAGSLVSAAGALIVAVH